MYEKYSPKDEWHSPAKIRISVSVLWWNSKSKWYFREQYTCTRLYLTMQRVTRVTNQLRSVTSKLNTRCWWLVHFWHARVGSSKMFQRTVVLVAYNQTTIRSISWWISCACVASLWEDNGRLSSSREYSEVIYKPRRYPRKENMDANLKKEKCSLTNSEFWDCNVKPNRRVALYPFRAKAKKRGNHATRTSFKIPNPSIIPVLFLAVKRMHWYISESCRRGKCDVALG